MFGRKKRERERGRQAAAEAFAQLDDALEHELALRAGTGIPDQARYATVAIVERLLPICRNDPNNVVGVVTSWNEQFDDRRDIDSDEDDPRATAATAICLAVAFEGVGNLFGAIPAEAPMFNPELAAKGRTRGWRR